MNFWTCLFLVITFPIGLKVVDNWHTAELSHREELQTLRNQNAELLIENKICVSLHNDSEGKLKLNIPKN